MDNAILYINGKPIGACHVELPAPVCEGDTPQFKASFTVRASFRYGLKPGKATRNYKKALLRLSMSDDAWQAVKFYHRIKRHQARKRR